MSPVTQIKMILIMQSLVVCLSAIINRHNLIGVTRFVSGLLEFFLGVRMILTSPLQDLTVDRIHSPRLFS